MQNFWERVDQSGGPDSCWPYVGAKNHFGYGSVWNRAVHRSDVAHRLAFRLANGYPATLQVLHHCDNPPCCNPKHLYEGTQKQNIRDAWDRGRIRPRFNTSTRGERHWKAKLTEREAKVIREMFRSGCTNKSSVGRLFGVSRTTIRDVLTRKFWRYVD